MLTSLYENNWDHFKYRNMSPVIAVTPKTKSSARCGRINEMDRGDADKVTV